ncbi:MAG: hypothetical protein M1814_004464 [Vezdaea aestivalis]|nr:MAG: hypothetical protein M1814_004464 [Vezdaea aestivalis]
MPAANLPGTAAPRPPVPAALSPQNLDIVPALYILLSRVALHNAANNPTAPVGDLDPQALPTVATDLKLRLQKARAAVTEIADVGRTVEEQQVEIERLRQEVGRKEEVLKALRGVGAGD